MDLKPALVPSKRTPLLLFIIVVFLATLVSSGLQIWYDHQETLTRTQTTARDVARVVEAQVRNTVRQADSTFELLGEMIRDNDGLASIQEPVNQRRLVSFSAAIPGASSIALVSPEGWMVALSGSPGMRQINVVDRDFFQAAKVSRQLFISPAIISRVPGQPILFIISKPVYDDSGKMLAIISAGMQTAHFTDFYGLMGFSVDPAVTVFRRNGDLVAQYPEMDRYVGRNFAASHFFSSVLPAASAGIEQAVSPVDEKPRIGAYQSVPELDLVIYAGIEVNSAFKGWQNRAWRTGLVDATALAFIYLVLFWGYRSFARQSELTLANHELDRISNLDALTGIPNRRAFDLALANTWSRFAQGGWPLTLLMIDVDSFKNFNDRYGHPAGDACLRRIAAALVEAPLRPVDIVARYGGEEFAVLVHADESGAMLIAERIRLAVQSQAIEHLGAAPGSGNVVTISIGIAQADATSMPSSAELVIAADRALYDAKARGRNRSAAATIGA